MRPKVFDRYGLVALVVHLKMLQLKLAVFPVLPCVAVHENVPPLNKLANENGVQLAVSPAA